MYSTRVYFFVIVILRQMIKYYAQAKEEIIRSPQLKKIVAMVEPENLKLIPAEFEIQIYQFLI